MKKKDAFNLFKGIKINTKNKSIEAQEKLLLIGYKWNGGSKGPIGNKKYLFIDTDGYITYSDSKERFSKELHKEVSVEAVLEVNISREKDAKQLNKHRGYGEESRRNI